MRRLVRISGVCLFVSGLAIGSHASSAPQSQPAVVADSAIPLPFVGCKSDGQVGPLEARQISTTEARLNQTVAGRLALYQAEYGPSVIGPRGWSCFGTYGSSGATLYVTPLPLSEKEWKGITGDGIEASLSDGGTSGRFTVAEIAARIFPSQRSFVQKVLDEHIVTGLNFPAGPFPADHMTYIKDLVVEYETPSNSEGLGTSRLLRSNGDSIHGVEVFDADEDVTLRHLALRLPKNMRDLEPVILKQFEATR